MGGDLTTTEITDSLEGIVLTEKGKESQREIVFVTNEDGSEKLVTKILVIK